MSRRLRAQLDRLEGQLREVQAPVVRHLRPPATATQVQHAFRASGVREHEDVVTWWFWHDGTDLPAATSPPGFLLPEPGNRLIGALHLPTLDQAMLGRRRAIEIDTEVWGAPLTYRPEWFPVLQFVDGWLVCVDTVGEKGPLGSLFVHDPHAGQDLGTEQPWMGSLSDLVEAVVDAYVSGRVSPTDLAVDFDELPGAAPRLAY